MLALTENDWSRATKLSTAGPAGDVAAFGSTHRTLTEVVVALVSVSTVLRTMNWLPYTRRDVPFTSFDIASVTTDCVALPESVAVSTRANVRPATLVMGAYT